MITKENVRLIFDYDELTGILSLSDIYTRITKGRSLDYDERKILSITKKINYIQFKFGKQVYQAHRVIWLWFHGEWPEVIDHQNGDTLDNKITNLRNVDAAENNKNRKIYVNNKTGYHGISIIKSGKFRAIGSNKGQSFHLGYFFTFEEAVFAKKEFEKEAQFHKNHGRVMSPIKSSQKEKGIS